MNAKNIFLAAAALVMSSGAAFAVSGERHAPAKKPLMSVSMDREIGQQRTTIFGLPASEPTIFGHPVELRDHDLDRTR